MPIIREGMKNNRKYKTHAWRRKQGCGTKQRRKHRVREQRSNAWQPLEQNWWARAPLTEAI